MLALEQKGDKTQVYDLDTSLEFPCSFTKYMEEALGADYCLKTDFHR